MIRIASCLGVPAIRMRTKASGKKRRVRIVEAAADLESTGRCVVGVVDEINHALVWKACFAFQLKIHRHGDDPRVLELAALDLIVIFLYCPLVDVEVRVDGINAHHFCQHGRIGLDQVAAGNELAGNAALDRGFDFGEVQVERAELTEARA